LSGALFSSSFIFSPSPSQRPAREFLQFVLVSDASRTIRDDARGSQFGFGIALAGTFVTSKTRQNMATSSGVKVPSPDAFLLTGIGSAW
jgi:hypothetical protein